MATKEMRAEYSRRYRISAKGKAAQARATAKARGSEASKASSRRKGADQRKRLAKANAGGCRDCGTTAKRLAFHHTRFPKLYNVGKMKGMSDEKFFAEVAKCVVLCQSCHMKRHWKDGKWRAI